jgi:hypothetical protein
MFFNHFSLVNIVVKRKLSKKNKIVRINRLVSRLLATETDLLLGYRKLIWNDKEVKILTQTDKTEFLKKLFKKGFTFKFTRKLNNALKDRNITHQNLSLDTGRDRAWFNRNYKNLEDMKLSTFVKVMVAVNRYTEGNKELPRLELSKVLDQELHYMASVIIDLSINGADYMLKSDKEFRNFITENMPSYVGLLLSEEAITQEDFEFFEYLVSQITKGAE